MATQPTSEQVTCYRIIADAAGSPITLTATAEDGSCEPLPIPPLGEAAGRSRTGAIATAILTHYSRENMGASPTDARRRAADHRTALSRVLATRLARSGEATVTSQEITTRLLTHLLRPPTDHWAARYSVERSDGTGTWTVSRHENGTWACSCPRWRFKREQCHHIEAVQAAPHLYPYLPPPRS